jgi:predicted nucleic acid-binding protein
MDEAQVVLNELLEMSLEVIPTSARLHQRALDWAERLGQSRAYDSQYVALAEQMGANLWTGDRRLANSSASLGLDWVHWVGED